MKDSKADLILHPVRMRIVLTLTNDRKLTVQQIGERLQDIPQATLYRHLNKLLEAKLVEIVAENQVRGAVEKVYSLPRQMESISQEEVLSWTPEKHMDSLIKFLTTVLSDFERYVSQEKFDLIKDRAGYRQFSFYATDEEFNEFLGAISQGAKKLIANEDKEDRRKRTVTTIVTVENKKEK